MRRGRSVVRLIAVSLLVFTMLGTARAQAQLFPPNPQLPPPPAELGPLLDALGPAGTAFLEGPCIAAGLALNLGLIAVPSTPNTIRALIGFDPFEFLPIDFASELDDGQRFILALQAAGCGLFPRPARRTVCAADNALNEATTPPDEVQTLIETALLEIVSAEVIPQFPAALGALVATLEQANEAGIPGAAEVYDAVVDALDCELRLPSDFAGNDFDIERGDPQMLGLDPDPLGPIAGPLLPPALADTGTRQATGTPPTTALGSGTANTSETTDEDGSAWLVVLGAVCLAVLTRRAMLPRSSRAGTHEG